MDDPCNDLGGGVPPICIKVKDHMCGILRAIQVMSFQYLVVSIKNAKIQSSTIYPMQAFASMRSIAFIEIDDKGGEIIQRYESFEIEIEIVQGDEIRYKSSKK